MIADNESPVARARAAALAELRREPRAVPWARQALRLVAVQAGLALVGIIVSLAVGIAAPSDLYEHLPIALALLAIAALGAVAAIAPRAPTGGIPIWRMAALVAAAAGMMAVVLARGTSGSAAHPEWVCSASHLGVGILPLLFALLGLRQSAPSWTGALAAGLGAGTTGALLGELACHRGAHHVLVYHLGAWAVLALACVALSRMLRPRTFAP